MKNRFRQLARCLAAVVFIVSSAFSAFAQEPPTSNSTLKGSFVVVNGAKLWYEVEGKHTVISTPLSPPWLIRTE